MTMFVSDKVPIEVQLRICGFTPAQCVFDNFYRVMADPVIRQRVDEALSVRRLTGRTDVNIFSWYLKIPARQDEAHLNFPANFNIEDDACVLAIFHKMNEQERSELRERVIARTRN
jgi:hypothetical protein